MPFVKQTHPFATVNSSTPRSVSRGAAQFCGPNSDTTLSRDSITFPQPVLPTTTIAYTYIYRDVVTSSLGAKSNSSKIKKLAEPN